MAYNYIITTDDLSAALEKIDQIKKSFKLEFDELSYDLEEDSLFSIVDELTTVSLFDNPKFIVVKNSELFNTVKDSAFTELLKAMNDSESQNVLILLYTKNFDAKHEHNEMLKKYSSMINIQIKNISFDEYITNSMQSEDYKIDAQAVSLLASYSISLSHLQQYIEQLKCFKANNKTITDKDIKAIVTKPLEDNVYQLLEAVLENNKKRIYQCYNDLKEINIQPSYLVSMLINKFQELYNVKVLAKSGVSQNEVAMIFNVSSGRAYYMLKNAKASKIENIKRNLDLLNELEYKIKSGKIEQSLGLELYFLN